MKNNILSTLIGSVTLIYILLDNTVLTLVFLGKPLCQEYQESYLCSLFGFGCPSDNFCYTEDQYDRMVKVVLNYCAGMIGMVIHELFFYRKETFLDVVKTFFVCLLIVIVNVINKE